MFEKLLQTYRAACHLLGLALHAPRQFCPRVLREIALSDLLGFYLQVLLLRMALDKLLFEYAHVGPGDTHGVFRLATALMGLAATALAGVVLFCGLLWILRAPVNRAGAAKYLCIYVIALGVVSVVVGSLTGWVAYSVTDGHAYLDRYPVVTPPIMGWVRGINTLLVPLAVALPFAGLLYLSAGRSRRVLAAFLSVPLVQILLTPLVTRLWAELARDHLLSAVILPASLHAMLHGMLYGTLAIA